MTRRTHAGRSLAEKQTYMETTVKRQFEPTFSDDDELVDFDATIETAPVNDTREQTHAPHRRQRTQESALATFIKARWPELAIVALVAWLASELFGLNREVGELKVQLHEQQGRTERLEQQLERSETRLSGEIDKLHDRVDPPPAKGPHKQ